MLSLLTLALTAFSAPPVPASAPTPNVLIAKWVHASSTERPRINIWLNKDDVYNRGDRARVYFKSDQDAYVTIVRIDTDGRLRVLFPIDPWEDNFARGGKTFEVLGRDRDEAFRIDDYPGVGYVFAIASEDPFTYDDIIRGDHWDYHTISDGRVRGDPYETVSDIADKIAREEDYDYDVSQYYVEKHYDYPRFVCYDCHTYTSWRAWDPYGSYCSRFRIVVYDDWYYYPYRYRNGGTYIGRPYRPGPRYVFKDANPRNDYITRVAERPRGDLDNRRPTIERDRTSADIGGRGAIPAPGSPRRQTPNGSDRAGVTGEPRRSPETRQPSPDGQPATPGVDREPRRRGEVDRPRDPGNTREVPPSTGGDIPRRRPSDDRSVQQGRPWTDQPDAPRTREPSRRDPQSTPAQREPSRQSPPQDSPRAEPRQAPPPRAEPRQSPPPRSTGEPQLRRRRP
ncbi:MAG: DUF4384 domain-containing protein [Gemmatimonadota bacterium]